MFDQLIKYFEWSAASVVDLAVHGLCYRPTQGQEYDDDGE